MVVSFVATGVANKHRLTPLFSPLSSPQAAAFLLLGLVVMVSSMSLIILDWIHNASATEETPANTGH